MREAIGGALLIKLVMFFIVIYVCFLAIAINYSITFRVKNQIINLIEAYEGYDNAAESIESYVADVGYFRKNSNSLNIDVENCNNKIGGYCISYPIESSNGMGYYYKVTAYVSFDFPIIGEVTNFPVSGETRIIYNK